MTSLASLSMRQCTVVPSYLVPHGRVRAGPVPPVPAARCGTVGLLAALPALRCVELVGMPYLRDEDFGGIGALTQLTSLLVCASGTITVRHATCSPCMWRSRMARCRLLQQPHACNIEV